MNELATLLWPTAQFVLCVLVIAVAAIGSLRLFVLRRHRRERGGGLLREPAQSLRRRLEVVNHRMVASALGLSLSLFAWALFYPAAVAATPEIWDTVVYAAAGVVALGWFAQEVIRYWPERAGLRDAIEAQAQTALSLNLLMRQKYWVFHDVHIGGFRINHLVLGPRGVFCIASIRRQVVGKLGWTGRKAPPKRECLFDGKALHFPGWEETEVLDQAEAPSTWLGPWLAAQVREPVENIPTFGAIALPGWQVTSTDWKRLLIFNPSTPNMLIQGAPEGRRIDTTTSQALLKVLQRNHQEAPEARLHQRVSVGRFVRAWVGRVLGRPA